MLYDSTFRYFIPRIIYEVSQGEFNYIDKVYGSLLGMGGVSSRGMMLAVQCHEELAFSSWEGYQDGLSRHPALAPMYHGSILGDLAYRACETWPAGWAEASANQPVHSGLPTLLLTGEFDPITPPAWGFHAAETLDRSYVFEFPGVGHGVSLADDCPRGMMIAFLQNPSLPPADGCIQAMK
jgi:pimeloyl-ACP methyl ester carboxylesterase